MGANKLTVLAPGAVVLGDLFCQGLLILEGGVEGNVVAERVVVKGTGWVRGNLSCCSLSIELGGVVDGQVSVVENRDMTALAAPRRAVLEGNGQKALPGITTEPPEKV